MDDKQIVDELTRASAGLLVMSESDYPLELIRWDGHVEVTSEFIRSLTNEPADSPIQEIDFDVFLGWRYQRLALLLKANLSHLRVYKVGRINMPVYIVGRSPEGNWLGLSTRVVET
jgi:hypothetical protein